MLFTALHDLFLDFLDFLILKSKQTLQFDGEKNSFKKCFSQLLVIFWTFWSFWRIGNFPDGAFSAVIFTTFAEHIKGILDGKSFDFSLFLNSKCKCRFVTPDKIFGMWANNLVQDGCAPIFELVQNILRRFVLDQLDMIFAQAIFQLLNFTARKTLLTPCSSPYNQKSTFSGIT